MDEGEPSNPIPRYIETWYIRPEGGTFDLHLYGDFRNPFLHFVIIDVFYLLML